MSSENTQAIPYEAVIFENKAEEPLLQKLTTTIGQVGQVFTCFRLSSLVLGLVVGCFIQMSTLGANYLIISIWGEDVILNGQRDIVIFSMLWSLVTSTTAIVILAFLRNIVSVSYDGEDIEDVILKMECRFVVGALIGVCGAWAATDVFLGMPAQILYSVGTLVVALAWCHMMMCFFRPTVARARPVAIPEELMIV